MTENQELKDEHTVFIGAKPFMNYVTGVVMQFTTQKASEVLIKARGKFITRAVDVAEVASKRFLEGQVDLAPNGIEIGSEEFQNKEGKNMGRLNIIAQKINLRGGKKAKS